MCSSPWRPVPPNDNIAASQPIGGTFGRTEGTNVNAGKEAGEPDHSSAGGIASVWYRWTAPANGRVKFDTVGSNFDTLLAVYTGDELGRLVRVGANDDSPIRCCSESRVAFVVSAGTVYQVAVDGFFGEMGSIVLNWSPVILGTSGADRLVGTPGPEEILGLGANDTILAGGGDDLILGGRGDDTIVAGAGNDWASGSVGSDRINGGSGDDLLFDFRGADHLLGRAGDDRLDVRDGAQNDAVRGGGGTDRCFADRGDVRRGCP